MDMKVLDAKDSTHFFRGSEEPQIYIDEFANELKYGFNQRFADWHDWLSGCMEKFNVSKKTNLKGRSYTMVILFSFNHSFRQFSINFLAVTENF